MFIAIKSMHRRLFPINMPNVCFTYCSNVTVIPFVEACFATFHISSTKIYSYSLQCYHALGRNSDKDLTIVMQRICLYTRNDVHADVVP